MDGRENFILGHGERLTSSIAPPAIAPKKESPYTFDEAKDRLLPRAKSMAKSIEELPSLTCPGDQTVAAFTLHPSYTAKSYYPQELFKALDLTPVGSRSSIIQPEKWTKKEKVKAVRSTTIFVSAARSVFNELPQRIDALKSDQRVAGDLVKIEAIEAPTEISKVGFIEPSGEIMKLEIVLHATEGGDEHIITGFKEYMESLGVNADIDRRLYSEGLCFIPAQAERSLIDDIQKFSFIRTVRSMPHLRSITRSNSTYGFEAELPDMPPVDPSVRVAVFDGGMAQSTAIDQWVRKYEVNGIGESSPHLLRHGANVTSALLFGPLKEGVPVERPYAYVDHYRVLDVEGDVNSGSETDMYHVLTAIRDTIDSGNYSFVNLSIGPDTPIEDDPVSSWTSILDDLFARRKILATTAIGNSGDRDRRAGLARIQPPSDGVNSLAVGAADSNGTEWQRASYSSFGPGRSPGVIKPDVVAFGGSQERPFYLVDSSNSGWATPDGGTSVAAPTVLRTALGIRSHFGEVLTPIALKALLVHSAIDGGHPRDECGWGRVPSDFREIVTTGSDTVRIVYQGILTPASWIKAPIPLPDIPFSGFVSIKATICYFTETDPKDSANYTRAGVEAIFRPNSERYNEPTSQYPKSESFFKIKEFELTDDPLLHKGHFWETVLTSSIRKAGRTLKNPEFNLHYNARDGGANAKLQVPEINYAMVITVSAPKHPELYNTVVNRYRTILEPLTPVVQIPIGAQV